MRLFVVAIKVQKSLQNALGANSAVPPSLWLAMLQFMFFASHTMYVLPGQPFCMQTTTTAIPCWADVETQHEMESLRNANVDRRCGTEPGWFGTSTSAPPG